MKRVHDYAGPTTSDHPSPPVLAAKRPVPRKSAKTTAPVAAAVKGSRVAKERPVQSSVQALQARRAKEVQQLNTQWNQRKTSLVQRLQSLGGPADITSHQQVNEDCVALQRIAQQLSEMG